MNIEEKNSILNLFRKWLSGDMRRAEEQQLEKLVADDPFLAEAMEGFDRLPEGEHMRQVTRLKADLRKRYQKDKRKGAFYIYRVAAAVAVLVVAVGGFWFLNQSGVGETKMAAQQEPATEKASPAFSDAIDDVGDSEVAEIASDPALDIETAIENDQAFDAQEEVKPKQQQPQIAAREEKRTLQNETIAANEGQKELAIKEDQQPTLDGIAIAEPVPSAPQEAQLIPPSAPIEVEPQEEGLAQEMEDAELLSINRTKEAAPANKKARRQNEPFVDVTTSRAIPGFKTINGMVIDGNGEPLIGASILVEGQNTGTVTDFDGNFELAVPEGTERLIVNYTGYQSQEIELADQNNLEVIMDGEEVLLDEVVVTGLGSKTNEKPAASYARPRDGYKSYKKYIEDNLRYPDEARSLGIEGRVKLRFKVYANGKPRDIEVIRSLGYGCDQEAIRLLKDGPRWEVSGNNLPLTKTYVIKFDLP